MLKNTFLRDNVPLTKEQQASPLYLEHSYMHTFKYKMFLFIWKTAGEYKTLNVNIFTKKKIVTYTPLQQKQSTTNKLLTDIILFHKRKKSIHFMS